MPGVTILEDSNQKIGQHAAKNEAWAQHGVNVVRNKLPYGDYVLAPTVSVDTKRDVQELAMDVKSDHRRFRDAAIKAMECGTYLVILVENEDGIKSIDDLEKWVEPDESFNRRKRKNIKAVRWRGKDIHVAKDGHEYDLGLAHICRTMSERYGMEFDFCSPDEAWSRVMMHLGVMV